MIRDDRAANEVVGFVLVFSLVLTTVSLVYAAGFAGLDSTRDVERVNNAERAFDVLANNFQQMGRGEAPNRATEIKLADAQLTTTAGREVTINASGMNATGASPVAIRYDTDGNTNIVYEHGAVIRTDGDSAVMRREPDFVFEDGNVVVRFIESRGSGQGVGGSASTVLVRAERRESAVLANRDTTSNVTVRLQTHPDRADVWEAYLNDSLATATGGSPTCSRSTVGNDTVEVVCFDDTADVDRLAVARVRIRVTLT
ncbi:hypothetical protein BRC88_00395 [Halobacteriales archaeon QS_4_69_225]|nr:MAG: hypothetical protein BRC88_00395 [Halobacteriales archaeon QS_4_69_225]